MLYAFNVPYTLRFKIAVMVTSKIGQDSFERRMGDDSDLDSCL